MHLSFFTFCPQGPLDVQPLPTFERRELQAQARLSWGRAGICIAPCMLAGLAGHDSRQATKVRPAKLADLSRICWPTPLLQGKPEEEAQEGSMLLLTVDGPCTIGVVADCRPQQHYLVLCKATEGAQQGRNLADGNATSTVSLGMDQSKFRLPRNIALSKDSGKLRR